MTKSKYTLKRVDENTVDYYLDDVKVYRHFKDSHGVEWWREYDENGNVIHYKSSDGFERWSKDNPNNPKNRPPEYVEPFVFTKEGKND